MRRRLRSDGFIESILADSVSFDVEQAGRRDFLRQTPDRGDPPPTPLRSVRPRVGRCSSAAYLDAISVRGLPWRKTTSGVGPRPSDLRRQPFAVTTLRARDFKHDGPPQAKSLLFTDDALGSRSDG